MSDFFKQLTDSLYTGFIDINKPSDPYLVPQILVNNKEEAKKVLTTIENELLVCDNFWFSVAFVTTNGVASLINTLQIIEKKGCFGKILVSKYLNFTQPEALARLSQLKNIELKIAVEGDFHSKGYLFRKGLHYNLIVGSSNLTANALSRNKELNLKISATPDSAIINSALKEFSDEFGKAVTVDFDFIQEYKKEYSEQRKITNKYEELVKESLPKKLQPNQMQVDALRNIEKLRKDGENKALLISATGTGKTYLSAFDVKAFNPKRFLFIVHRFNIIESAIITYEKVFGNTITIGKFSGNEKEVEKDFIFTTIQTISLQKNLNKFKPDQFDYIVIDESHRAGAKSYQKVIKYFKPKFLLGMTATPERTDGLDIFKSFDYNIAYEIRLHKALEMEMVSPFHYYGIQDILVDDKAVKIKDFKKLASKERIKHIIDKAKFYGTDDGILRGLVFCSSLPECKILSEEFNKLNYKTIALSGKNEDDERSEAIRRLESDIPEEKLDYIFTYDIFNEGIDIPKANQIILLRPTKSSIVFVQQLGRGLRKIDSKEYLTVLDFIGNYQNNYLVPIALYGDQTYNKNKLRQLINRRSATIPGTSTINFDEVTKSKIFESINKANLQQKRELLNDYKALKLRVKRIPMMMDFLMNDLRDPKLYIDYAKSYYNFVRDNETEYPIKINGLQKKLLELFSNEINNAIRIEETLILSKLITTEKISKIELINILFNDYNIQSNDSIIESAVNNLNFGFITERINKKLVPVKNIYNLKIINYINDTLEFSNEFKENLKNQEFSKYLIDTINYSLEKICKIHNLYPFISGFHLYQKYTRKDVFRILNWKVKPLEQNVGGYSISSDDKTCPIFVTYHKSNKIPDSTNYEDRFESKTELKWMTKSKRTLNSPDVRKILKTKNPMRLPLFIKKSDKEGIDYYYIGELKIIEDKTFQTRMSGKKNEAVVSINFNISPPVEDSLYNYIIEPI